MAHKRLRLLFFSLISLSLILPPAFSAAAITDFDGTYKGNFTMTITVTVPTKPPQKMTKTSTIPMKLLVHDGQILGWGKGMVINKAGKATMTLPIAGYGSISFTVYFSRNHSTDITTLTGVLSGAFPSANAVISGKFTATGGEKFLFSIDTPLKEAHIGKKYDGVSLCAPPVKPGGMCGIFPKSRNPSGGNPPYRFGLQSGSDFLPTGIVLNFRTGEISGTPMAGQKPDTRHLIICAYDSNDWFTGVCRKTTLTLKR